MYAEACSSHLSSATTGCWTRIAILQANQSAAKAAADAAAEAEKAETQQMPASATGTPSAPPAAAGGWGADLLQVPCLLRPVPHISKCNSLQ